LDKPIEDLHTQIRELIENTPTFDEVLDRIIPCLDEVGVAATQVRVVGGSTENSVTISATDEAGSSQAYV
jgi:hypothetical protein